MLSLITEDLGCSCLPTYCYLSWIQNFCGMAVAILSWDQRCHLLRCFLTLFIFNLHFGDFECMHDACVQMSVIAYADVFSHTSVRSRLCFTVCELLTSGLNLSMFPAVGWAGKWQALSKISAVFTGMMGISGTFPTAVKSSTIPALLNTPGSFFHPARVPIKQLRHLVFGNSLPRKGVINSWKTVFTVKAS